MTVCRARRRCWRPAFRLGAAVALLLSGMICCSVVMLSSGGAFVEARMVELPLEPRHGAIGKTARSAKRRRARSIDKKGMLDSATGRAKKFNKETRKKKRRKRRYRWSDDLDDTAPTEGHGSGKAKRASSPYQKTPGFALYGASTDGRSAFALLVATSALFLVLLLPLRRGLARECHKQKTHRAFAARLSAAQGSVTDLRNLFNDPASIPADFPAAALAAARGAFAQLLDEEDARIRAKLDELRKQKSDRDVAIAGMDQKLDASRVELALVASTFTSPIKTPPSLVEDTGVQDSVGPGRRRCYSGESKVGAGTNDRPDSTVADLPSPEQVRRMSREVKLVFSSLTDEVVERTVFEQTLKHKSERILQDRQQQHESAMHADRMRHEAQVLEERRSDAAAQRKLLEETLEQEQKHHDENRAERERAAGKAQQERDLERFVAARKVLEEGDWEVFKQTVWIGVVVILSVCVVVLWDRHSAFADWFSSCGNVGSNIGARERSFPSLFSITMPWGGVFGGSGGSTSTSLASMGCKAMLFGKVVAALGVGIVSFAIVSSLLGIQVAFSLLAVGLLFVVRQEVGAMLKRGFLALPLFLFGDWSMFWMLRGCCGRRPPLEWNVCGLNIRPLVVRLFLPMLTIAFATTTGVHVSCDATNREACWDTLWSAASALVF